MKKMENQPNQTMDRRCRHTKQAISNAMLELIQEKPLSSITVSELADRADINRKTFYKHYHDTMAVLDEIEDRIVEKIFSNLNRENVLLDIEDPYPFLCRIGEGMRVEGPHMRTLIDAGQETRITQKLDQTVSRMLDSFLQHNTMIDPTTFRFFATFLVAGIRSIYIEILMGKTNIPVERYNEMIAELIGHAKKMLRPASHTAVRF